MRRAAGYNQYRTINTDDFPTASIESGLMTQEMEPSPRRCEEVWGTRCGTQMQSPDFPTRQSLVEWQKDLNLISDYHQLWSQAEPQPRPEQLAQLCVSSRMSLDATCEMLDKPPPIGTTIAGCLSKLILDVLITQDPNEILPIVGDWTSCNRLLTHWPKGHEGVVSVLSAMSTHSPERTWALMLEDSALGQWSHRVYPLHFPLSFDASYKYRWPSKYQTKLWAHASLYYHASNSGFSLAPYISHVLHEGVPDTVAAAVRSIKPTDDILVPDLWKAVERDQSFPMIQAIAFGLGRLIPPEQKAECAQRLWDFIPSNCMENMESVPWRRTVIQLVISFPQAPAYILWAGYKASVYSADPRLQIDRMWWTPELCDMAYHDPIANQQTWVKETLLQQEACSASILDEETRSRNQHTVWMAALNLNCPADGLMRVLQRVDCPSAIRKKILKHPNLPEQYRALAYMLQ